MEWIRSKLNNRNIILIALIIPFLSIFLAFLVNGIFDNLILNANKEWNKTLKFSQEDVGLFPYSVKTQQGNLYAEGQVLPASPLLVNENLDGEFMAIKETFEEYRMHTETYPCNCRTVNDSTKCDTCTKTYWSWDYDGQNVTKLDKISLLGQEFDSNFFPWENGAWVSYDTKEGRYKKYDSHHRSYFHIVPTEVNGGWGFRSTHEGFTYAPDLCGPQSNNLEGIKNSLMVIVILLGIGGQLHLSIMVMNIMILIFNP